MSNVFLTMFSASRLSESMKGMGRFKPTGVYNEEAFRYLLESESKRSERSGHLYQILLVSRTNAQGAIVRMDSDVAKTVIAAVSKCLRETDYIGWYREGRVVGGVLTVVGRDSVADAFNRLQLRLLEIIRADLGVEESGRFQIQVCQHHELEGAEIGEQSA